jgi:electron transfer flavoprotein beta subunit
MKAKKVTIDTAEPQVAPVGTGRVTLELPPTQPSMVEVLGSGPEAAPAVVDLLYRLGVVPK